MGPGVQGKADRSVTRALEEMTDEDLILAYQQENTAAFGILVGRFKNPLMNYVFRFVGDVDDANDIVQETFIRVHRSRNSYKPVARFSTWVYTIAGNLARSHLRRVGARRFFSLQSSLDHGVPMEIADTANTPDVAAESELIHDRIQQALARLSPKYREVIVLREIQEMSYEEIASITGLNIGTVKSRINRGRAHLQKMLKDLVESPS